MDKIHDQIVLAFNNYLRESQSFDEKKVKVAASRARKSLSELAKLCKDRRKELQDIKNEMQKR